MSDSRSIPIGFNQDINRTISPKYQSRQGAQFQISPKYQSRQGEQFQIQTRHEAYRHQDRIVETPKSISQINNEEKQIDIRQLNNEENQKETRYLNNEKKQKETRQSNNEKEEINLINIADEPTEKDREKERMFELNQKIDTMLDNIIDETLACIVESVKKPIKILQQQQNNTTIVSYNKSKMTIIKQQIILDIAHQVMVQLNQIDDTHGNPFPESLFNFLSIITAEKAYVADEFLFKFELDRLNFHKQLGYLINITKDQSRMIISIFLIVKVLMDQVITRPWEQYPELNIVKDVSLSLSIKIIVSIIYHVLMKFNTDQCQITQSHENVDQEFRCKPCKMRLELDYDQEKFQPEPVQIDTSTQIICGIFSQVDLDRIFVDDKKYYENAKTDIRKELFEFLLQFEHIHNNNQKKMFSSKFSKSNMMNIHI